MLHKPDDMWDPNTWSDPDDREYRIYAPDLETYALVSAIDYPYLCQFSWSIHTVNIGKRDRSAHANVRKRLYLRRGVSIFNGPDGEPYVSPIHGHVVRHRNRTQKNVFLHQEVIERMGTPPPSPLHTLIDHIDRDTMNCRRWNLEWETKSGNTLNSERGGKPKQVFRNGGYR